MQQLNNWYLTNSALCMAGSLPGEEDCKTVFATLCTAINAHILQWYEGADRLQCHFRIGVDEFQLYAEYLCDACWIEPLHSDGAKSLTKLHKTLQQNGLLTQSKHT